MRVDNPLPKKKVWRRTILRLHVCPLLWGNVVGGDEAKALRDKATRLRDCRQKDKAMDVEGQAMDLESQAHDLLGKAEEILWQADLEVRREHEIRRGEQP